MNGHGQKPCVSSANGCELYFEIVRLIACRGLVVVGELQGGQQAAAAARIGTALGWPIVADVLSGEWRLNTAACFCC